LSEIDGSLEMKTDSLFYRLFQLRPQLLFELLNDTGQRSSDYQFSSVEVKQLAFRMDGLFLPTSGDSSLPLYLVEVQFQPDEQLYYRLFAELFLYLRQYQPPHPWRVVVIYPTRSMERYSQHFQDLLNSEKVTRIYLDELQVTASSPLGVSLISLIVTAESEMMQQARNLLQRATQEVETSQLQQDIIDVIETIVVYKFPQMTRQEIATMLGVDDLKQTRFYQEVFEEGKQQGIEQGKQQGIEQGKQQGIEQGKQQGIEQGKQQGIEQGKLEAVSRMINLGWDFQTIAQCIDLPVEVVRQQAHQTDQGKND